MEIKQRNKNRASSIQRMRLENSWYLVRDRDQEMGKWEEHVDLMVIGVEFGAC